MSEGEHLVPVGVKDWERKFAENPDEWFFGREPSDRSRLTLNYWRLLHGDRRGRVLDLGCGEGRDAVYFAHHGFSVTAVDGAQSALDKTSRLADERNAPLAEIIRSDITAYRPDGPFEIVLAHNCLQFLGDRCLPELFRVQSMVVPEGLCSVEAFTREAEALANKPDLYRFDHNELKFHFRGWQLFIYDEHILWREPAQCYLSFAHIIAKKPVSVE